MASADAHRARDRGRPSAPRGRISICMVSDFFLPDIGGVEQHIFRLSVELLALGHKVVVVTRCRGDRVGIRYLSGGLKVYFVPVQPLPIQTLSGTATTPAIFVHLPIFRDIYIRESIDLVHAHQAFSSLAHESVLHASAMHIPTVFTDHSLFGFGDASSIHLNKMLQFTSVSIDRMICVSYTSKENSALRMQRDPDSVYVIPNAVDAEQFRPRLITKDPPSGRSEDPSIVIVVLSRLVQRKGMDLLTDVIPLVCRRHTQVKFRIGGDGPWRLHLEEMREMHRIAHRVELCGAISHDEAPGFLQTGDVFLNCSHTEAFCMAIVEAASCGLYVVSTAVGGVPEVLPDRLITLASPIAQDIADKLTFVIEHGIFRTNRHMVHEIVRECYSWRNVAERTLVVYRDTLQTEKIDLHDRLKRFSQCGPLAGPLFVAVAVIHATLLAILEYFRPTDSIDRVPFLNRDSFFQQQNRS